MDDGAVSGSLDLIEGGTIIHGWAASAALSDSRLLRICVVRDGVTLAEGHPTVHRADLPEHMLQPAGYRLELPSDVDLAELLNGRISVVADDGKQRWILQHYELASDQLKILCALRLLSTLARPARSRLLKEVAALDPQAAAISDKEVHVIPPEDHLQLSDVALEVGCQSQDGSTVLGYDGTLFLVGGTNAVSELYSRTVESEERAEALGLRWRDLFKARAARMDSRGIRYIQMIIPEKQTIQGRFMDPPVHGATPTLEVIERSSSASYISVRDIFLEGEATARTYRRTDTHLTAHGAQLIAHAISGRLGIPKGVPQNFATHVRWCDLGTKFNPPLWDRSLEPCAVAGTADPVVVKAVLPEGGGHLGRHYVFQNSQPLSPFKAVCFGNSFFEGGYHALTLTWWMARMFAEFHFLWQPAIDDAYIDEIHPDVVIGQTIERFLEPVPNS